MMRLRNTDINIIVEGPLLLLLLGLLLSLLALVLEVITKKTTL
jgi:hypothetical protein